MVQAWSVATGQRGVMNGTLALHPSSVGGALIVLNILGNREAQIFEVLQSAPNLGPMGFDLSPDVFEGRLGSEPIVRYWQIVLKKSANKSFGMDRRDWRARGLFGAQASFRAGGRISFASFRRFWAVAARRNSS